MMRTGDHEILLLGEPSAIHQERHRSLRAAGHEVVVAPKSGATESTMMVYSLLARYEGLRSVKVVLSSNDEPRLPVSHPAQRTK